MEQNKVSWRMLSALLRAAVPAALGALGAVVATIAPIHFSAFCNGVVG